MGLYRDNGLIIIRNPKRPKLDTHRKNISNVLKLQGFKITINTKLKIVNFLAVTLNLKKGTFEPYKKREQYTHLHSHLFKPPTHPQSSSKYSNRLVTDYPRILLTSTFSTKTNTYDNVRKIAVINKHKNTHDPPYNKSVTSNIGRDVLNLISKHFPNRRPLVEIFKISNIKVSYSCTSNISQILKGHYKNIETLHSNEHPNKQCNCMGKETYHL